MRIDIMWMLVIQKLGVKGGSGVEDSVLEQRMTDMRVEMEVRKKKGEE